MSGAAIEAQGRTAYGLVPKDLDPLGGASEAVSLLDADLRIRWVNPRAPPPERPDRRGGPVNHPGSQVDGPVQVEDVALRAHGGESRLARLPHPRRQGAAAAPRRSLVWVSGGGGGLRPASPAAETAAMRQPRPPGQPSRVERARF